MRVTENMKFNLMMHNMNTVQSRYNELLEKMASQKEINKPSDDPLGMARVFNYRGTQEAITQYHSNMEHCRSVIEITESKLTGVNDLLVNAREIAVAQASSGSNNEETRGYAVSSMEELIEEFLSLANATLDNQYLFAGTRTNEDMSEVPFFSVRRDAPEIDDPVASGNNGDYDGTVSVGGIYTGDVNKTYVVKITSDGQALADSTYVVSSDGGKTWGAEQNDLDDGVPVTIGDGIEVTFTEGTAADLAENDIFTVRAYTEGYYNGNGDSHSVEIGKDASFTYTLSGEEVFTDRGDGEVDILQTLNDLKDALENNDDEGIQNSISALKDASEQINRGIAVCGTRVNRLDIAGNNLTLLDEKITEMIANTEDVDITKLVTEFSMKEIALQATYAFSADIQNMSILNFLT